MESTQTNHTINTDSNRIMEDELTKALAEQKAISKQLEDSYKTINMILNSIKDITLVIDPVTYEIIFTNKIFEYYFGEKENYLYKTCYKVLRNSAVKCADCPLTYIDNVISTNMEFTREKYYEDIDCWFMINYSISEWIDGSTVIYVFMSNITTLKQQELKVLHMAYYDQLLDIPNRLKFNHDMSLLLENNSNGAMIYLDIDNFKYVNDTYGHYYGDLLLKNICNYLQSFPINDHIYRLGGDEFIIILDDYTIEESKVFLNNIIERFHKPWNFDRYSRYFTVSIGVSMYPRDGKSLEDIVRNSDIALFKAKSSGKDSICYYKEEFNDEFSKRVQIEDHLRNTINNNFEEFSLYYQPIVNIVTGKCTGAEALLRWENEELGMVNTEEFISLAEQLGLIIPIGEWVLETACKMCRKLQKELNSSFRMNINVSNKQLQIPNFLATVKAAINRSGVSANSIILEITETVDPKDVDKMNITLKELKKIGVSIAMDDFGTGYSSLSNIMDLTIDIIKIDRSFVSDLANSRLQATFVRTITNLSQALNKRVCIEGVETKEQLDVLKGMGNISIVQGYYYSKPLTFEDFKVWYDKL